MTNITKEIIENKLSKITFDNNKNLLEENIIEGISHKDGHVQISLYANKSNLEEIEEIGKLIEQELMSIKGMISVTAVLTNQIPKKVRPKIQPNLSQLIKLLA